jgi:hypothetical protein
MELEKQARARVLFLTNRSDVANNSDGKRVVGMCEGVGVEDLSVIFLSEEQFEQELKRFERKFIFFHGFNKTFSQSCAAFLELAILLSVDLPKTVFVLFAWPSVRCFCVFDAICLSLSFLFQAGGCDGVLSFLTIKVIT